MVVLLAELVLVALLAGLLVLGIWAVRTALRADPGGSGPAPPTRQRAELARAVAAARWAPAHDEPDGVTRVLLRRSCTGPDGLPLVLEDRVFASFPADDPAWEARFTEAMAAARFRCGYLNAEESPPA